MDITLSKVETVVFIQHDHDRFNGYYNSIIIYTDKGQIKYNIELFGDKPLVIQLGDNEE